MNKLNLKWVSDTIGEDYKYWNPGDTVLIQAQTMTGKTWFIQNVLLDYISPHEKLLLVCNRTHLKRQLKKDLLRKYSLPIPETIEELDKITTINNKITITSYHAISNSIQDEIYGKGKSDFSMYDYIVFDECHFIFSDGSFNNKTRFCYEKIVKEYYHNKIKIFISATMQEIRERIIKNVEHVQNHGFVLDTPSIHEYTTGTDYSYVSPYYFKRIIDIINLIKNDKTDDKWLIFISDLRDGRNILKSLGEDNCSLIKSGTVNDEVNSIVNEGKFNKKVLVCTKTLDNGINLFDSQLKNVAIMTWDQITFIQMLGRKRVNINNPEQVNLYIPLRYKKSFRSKLIKCDNKLEEINLLTENEIDFYRKYDNDLKDFKDMNDIFYRSMRTGQIKVNPIGYYRLNADIKFYKYMMYQFKNKGEFAYIHEQLKWIGLEDNEPEERYIGEVIVEDEVNKLEKHLNSIVGLKLFNDEQQEISDLIIKELITVKSNTDYRTKKLKPSTLESIIRVQLGLPYAVSKPKQETSGANKGKRYIIITEIK